MIISTTKSSIGFSLNTTSQDKDLVFSKFNFPLFDHSISYLGIPLLRGSSKTAVFGYILTKAENKLKGWKCKNLSFAGRETLIKSVIQLIPQYLFSCVLLPKKICSKIEYLIQNFWWNRESNSVRMCWRKWELLKISKDQGGIGFKDVYSSNMAMILKLG